MKIYQTILVCRICSLVVLVFKLDLLTIKENTDMSRRDL